MGALDDPSACQRIDPGGTRALIRDVPRQCRLASREAQALDILTGRHGW